MSLTDYYTSEACKFRKAGKPAKAAKPLTAKPAEKGIVAKERHQKKLAQARTKSAIREQVRELDGYRCRWPECATDPLCETTQGALEVAHYAAEGAGGDPLLARYEPENLILLCHFHHRSGPRSLHSGNARMEPLSEQGMRGGVMFLELEIDAVNPRWFVVGVTEPPKTEER